MENQNIKELEGTLTGKPTRDDLKIIAIHYAENAVTNDKKWNKLDDAATKFFGTNKPFIAEMRELRQKAKLLARVRSDCRF